MFKKLILFDPGRGISIDDKNTPQPHAKILKFIFLIWPDQSGSFRRAAIVVSRRSFMSLTTAFIFFRQR